jgi:dCMP deaminase
MKIAYAVSERSTCDRALVGCVLVTEKRILTSGFNGSPAGQEHCDEIGHFMVDGHCVARFMRETNAIIQAALHGVSTKGATCYVTHLPALIAQRRSSTQALPHRLQCCLSHR